MERKKKSKWETFEEDMVKFLQEKFGNYATFIHEGKSNAKVPDVKVLTKKGNQFYIEAKHSPAQCGQFVLLPNDDERKFEYSPQNATEIDEFSRVIIDNMNNDFESFKKAGTAGKEIEFDGCQEIFKGLIIKTYKAKGVKYFITNNGIIFPIEKIAEYFDISAKYRMKRSGSTPIARKNVSKVIEQIKAIAPNDEIIIDGKKMFIKSNKNLHDKRFFVEGNEYRISELSDMFEVRILSNTYNHNVIFSVKLKNVKEGISIPDFICILSNRT